MPEFSTTDDGPHDGEVVTFGSVIEEGDACLDGLDALNSYIAEMDADEYHERLRATSGNVLDATGSFEAMAAYLRDIGGASMTSGYLEQKLADGQLAEERQMEILAAAIRTAKVVCPQMATATAVR